MCVKSSADDGAGVLLELVATGKSPGESIDSDIPVRAVKEDIRSGGEVWLSGSTLASVSSTATDKVRTPRVRARGNGSLP